MVKASKKAILDFLKENSDIIESMDIVVLEGNSIENGDLTGITEYLKTVATSEEYDDITPKKISNISPFMKIFNDKKGDNFVQIYEDYHNKFSFKNLGGYMKFRTKLKMFDYRIRASLTAINSEVLKENDVEFNAF